MLSLPALPTEDAALTAVIAVSNIDVSTPVTVVLLLGSVIVLLDPVTASVVVFWLSTTTSVLVFVVVSSTNVSSAGSKYVPAVCASSAF